MFLLGLNHHHSFLNQDFQLLILFLQVKHFNGGNGIKYSMHNLMEHQIKLDIAQLVTQLSLFQIEKLVEKILMENSFTDIPYNFMKL
jgi:hypothetical protein